MADAATLAEIVFVVGSCELTGCEVSEYTVNVIASRGDDVLGYKLSYSNGDQQQEASDPAAEEDQVADGISADGTCSRDLLVWLCDTPPRAAAAVPRRWHATAGTRATLRHRPRSRSRSTR